MSVALYCRVSSDEQVARHTVDAQRDFLQNYAKLYTLDVYKEYVDEGISGTIPMSDRVAGSRLLQDAEHKSFDKVIVYRLDRLGRSLSSILDAYNRLDALKVTITSATEPFDTSTAIGKFLFQFLGSLSELERETINERMTLGRERVARAGKWTNGPIPYGYDLDADGKLTPSMRIVSSVGMTESAIVADLFSRIAGGSTVIKEKARLDALKIPPVRRYAGNVEAEAAKSWARTTLQHILHNPVYTLRIDTLNRQGLANQR